MNYVGDINEMVVFQLYFYRSCPAELCCSCEFDDYGGSQDICDINLARSLVFTRSEVSGIPEPWRSRRSAWAEFLWLEENWIQIVLAGDTRHSERSKRKRL